MMVSEKVFNLLVKYEIPTDSVESDAQGWALISQKTRKPQKPKPSVSFCFSGFTESRKVDLVERAKHSGFGVNSSVAKATTHLICGPNKVGPTKFEKATQQGVVILNEAQFLHMVETGEIL